MSLAPLTIGQVVSAHARLQPEKTAARDLTRSMNYRQWNERSCRLANALIGLGLSRGERVAVLSYNRVEWAEIYIAMAKSGLITVPINFRFTGPEVYYILKDSSASALIVEDELIPVVESIRGSIEIPEKNFVGIGDLSKQVGWREYEDLLYTGAATEPDATVNADDP